MFIFLLKGGGGVLGSACQKVRVVEGRGRGMWDLLGSWDQVEIVVRGVERVVWWQEESVH